MRQQRLAKQASAARDRPTSASLAAWAEMHRGSAAGQAFCLRFRLQPGSENGALRDPVAYRVILEPHYKTGACKLQMIMFAHVVHCNGRLVYACCSFCNQLHYAEAVQNISQQQQQWGAAGPCGLQGDLGATLQDRCVHCS
jgi:hypothetical protein